MTLNDELQGQMSGHVYLVIHMITYEEIQPSTYENQPVEKGR